MSFVRPRFGPLLAAVLAGLLLGASLGYLLIARSSPSYTSRSLVMVSPTTKEGASDFLDRVPTLAELGKTDSVLGPAASELGLSGPGDVGRLVKVTSAPKTILLNVDAVAPSADQAHQAARVVSEKLTAAISKTYGPSVPRNVRIGATIVAPATSGKRTAPISPLVSASVGALVGVGLVYGVGVMLRATRRRPGPEVHLTQSGA